LASRHGRGRLRILKGAKPAALPVEQASRHQFAINFKTASALGLTIPPSILTRADEIIAPPVSERFAAGL
jgi:ABC-type uncharacterized transport system substrate-binding protein